MKFQETHFEEYILECERENLHPKMIEIYNKFPENIQRLKNLIFFGPNGTGKYTQMLKSIKKYSPTELKYEKKISVTFNKQTYFFKISDIHYEVDLSLLGCNSKQLWHEIYLQIVDIVSAKTEKSGIIVCKNFNKINSDLLDNFYSYIQKTNTNFIHIVFILLTEDISFIPDNILNSCEIIYMSRPSKILYNKISKKLLTNIKLENIKNIKGLHDSISDTLNEPHKIICDKIIKIMINPDTLEQLIFRDHIYDLFIFNLNVNECIWYIINELITNKKIKKNDISLLMKKLYCFFQYFNNNYRPIYHMEYLFYYIITLIHGD
jgi:hypothetical protein